MKRVARWYEEYDGCSTLDRNGYTATVGTFCRFFCYFLGRLCRREFFTAIPNQPIYEHQSRSVRLKIFELILVPTFFSVVFSLLVPLR